MGVGLVIAGDRAPGGGGVPGDGEAGGGGSVLDRHEGHGGGGGGEGVKVERGDASEEHGGREVAVNVLADPLLGEIEGEG